MSKKQKIIIAAAVILAVGLVLLLKFKGNEWFGTKEPAITDTAPRREYQEDLPRTTSLPADAQENATIAEDQTPPETGEEQGYTPGDVVTPQFVLDLARYAASNYHPAHTRHNAEDTGLNTLSFKKLNMRYGVTMTGLDVDVRNVEQARDTVFGLILNPIVLRTIYNVYKNEFMAALVQEAGSQTRLFKIASGDFEVRTMEPAHIQEMLNLQSAMSRDVGLVFRSFAANPGLMGVMGEYFGAVDRVHAAYGEFASLEAQGKTGEALTRVSDEIREAIISREGLRSAILNKAVPEEAGFRLSDGDVMDIASWIYRRVSPDAERMASMGALASLFLEFAEELQQNATSQAL